MNQIIFASNNNGKIKEVSAILAPLGIKIIPQSTLNIPEVEETGLTFIENAILKARHCSNVTGLPVLADDSGLEVHKLDGSPGIFSARYAGKNATSSCNIEKLIKEVQTIPAKQRTANFTCVMALMRFPNDPTPIITHGSWDGIIVDNPTGNNGFGYDPIFFDPTFNKTASEIEPHIKNKISHRAKALAKLKSQLITLSIKV